VGPIGGGGCVSKYALRTCKQASISIMLHIKQETTSTGTSFFRKFPGAETHIPIRTANQFWGFREELMHGAAACAWQWGGPGLLWGGDPSKHGPLVIMQPAVCLPGSCGLLLALLALVHSSATAVG